MTLTIRNLQASDCELIEASFAAQQWRKPANHYHAYLDNQERGRSVTRIGFLDSGFVGYCCVEWNPHYQPFKDQKIPVISDLNVLISGRGRGFGKAFIADAERIIKERSPISGIGVGLLPDYGHAQRLYIKLGYMPNGCGVTFNHKTCAYDEQVRVNDDLVLWLTRTL